MNTMLEEIILQKCRKKVTPLEPYDEKDEEEEETLDVVEEESETKEELPFEDIIADKRRKYNAKEEFIFLLYNDVLNYFVKEWDGKYLRKAPPEKIHDDSEDESGEGDYYYEESDYDNTEKFKETDNNSEKHIDDASDCPWKLKLPDEFANIQFISNNTYRGRISRKMMEGKGVYRWSSGAQYKGEFEQNRMHGRGLLEWNSTCWYEGDFVNSYRHGKGIMVDGDSRYMYTGQWFKGHRHGKGYCRYGDKGSYDGDWVMDKMNGVGLRIYPSDARYVGHWKNGIRDGIGTMVWTNGNVYRGGWKCGAMNGYGEYIWNGFFNQTLTWPQEASYVGYWRHNMRHGQGEIKLKSVGGARYSGLWKDNKKHGHGTIIGNNGEKFESNPLFLNDILCTRDGTSCTSENKIDTEDEHKCVRSATEIKSLFPEKPDKLAESSLTPVLKPEQFPCLSYYITRLLDLKSLEPTFAPSISSGKCYRCENESCSCLAHPISTDSVTSERNGVMGMHSSETNLGSNMESTWDYEERWAYNCLTLHMLRLRKIYNDYATLFAKSPSSCNVSMSRLCLWQLWRDCGIHTKGLSLNDIDNYIAKNEDTLVKDPLYPFEKIEIWQYLHALIEVSWHLYTKYNDIDVEDMNGKLAAGLHKFLKCDIYPHAGYHVDNLCRVNIDLLPIYCVFELYQELGYPPSATDLLRMTCVLKGTRDSQSSSTTLEIAKNFPYGINTVTIGEKVSYFKKLDGTLASPHCTIDVPRKSDNNLSNGLSVFRQLGASKMVEIMTLICPRIKDTSSDLITNMDYKLTFLEFYEIILEATKQLLSSKKESEQKLQEKVEEDTTSTKTSNLQEKGTARITEPPSTRKDPKSKYKTSK